MEIIHRNTRNPKNRCYMLVVLYVTILAVLLSMVVVIIMRNQESESLVDGINSVGSKS